MLSADGFELYRGASEKGRVAWNQVDKIFAFKEDLVTYDLVCMEFIIKEKNEVFEVNDEVEGFWEMVERIKEAFPSSLQEWEAVVVKPAYARNPTLVFERSAKE